METGKLSSKHSFVYGEKIIEYDLFVYNRQTLEIAVHPDCSVVVKAPLNSDIVLIEKKIIKKARWIIKQKKYFSQFNPKTPDRCFVGGETYLYLGKHYRLKFIQSNEDLVKLSHGLFCVYYRNSMDVKKARKLIEQWYLNKAYFHFEESLERCWQKFKHFEIDKPKIQIKRMNKRWGSLTDKCSIVLNRNLIRAPKECIDYVVTHELCHLKYRNHRNDFYDLLESIMPNWKSTKQKLELMLA